MIVPKVLVTAAALLAVGAGAAGCHGDATSSTSSQNGAGQLSSVRTTLDQIDSEMAGDGS